MFNVHVNDGTTEMPKEDILYIIAKEGIFLKKKLGVMESVAPVKNISYLNSVATSAKMNIKKIPSTSFARVMDFFKKVYDKFSGEAVVLLFYNEETRKYRIMPPHQKVTASSLEYNRGISLDGWTTIGTIHSHARMSAFHSGVDDDDEKTFDGLHITIGNVNDDNISISASIVANGYRVMVGPEEYIDGIKKVVDIDEKEDYYHTKIYKWLNNKLQMDVEASKKSMGTRRKFDKRYVSTAPPSKSICNPKWMSVVEKGVYVWKGNYNYRGGRYGGYGGYGGNYDSHAWHQAGRFSKPGTIVNPQKHLPPGHWSNKPQKTIINEPECEKLLQSDTELIPCLTCKHRDEKLILEENEEFEENLLFKCTKCEGIIKEDEVDDIEKLQCPVCKTDEHFTLFDETDLASNYKTLTEADVISMQPDEDGFYICKGCNNTFLRFSSDVECPYCLTLLPEVLERQKCISELTGEEALIQQSRNDSGQFLGEGGDEAQEEALKQAAADDETLERIPDPGKKEIPLPLQHSPSASLLNRFKKVFGGKGAD